MRYNVYADIFNRNGAVKSPVMLRVSWNCQSLDLRLGLSCNTDDWDKQSRQVLSSNADAEIINSAIADGIAEVKRFFATATMLDKRIPTKAELKEAFDLFIGRPSAMKKLKKETTTNVYDRFGEYIKVISKRNEWSNRTYDNNRYCRNHLHDFDANLTFDDLTVDKLYSFVDYLHSLDLKNSSIDLNIRVLNPFLRWADQNGYINNKDYLNFKPKLKGINGVNEIVYLEWDELMRVYNYAFPEAHKYLEETRDAFCFCCFSGIRFSDLKALKKTDIYDGTIHVVTQKTMNAIAIELNDYSREIFEKYLAIDPGSNLLFNTHNNNVMNRRLKEICRLVGINSNQRKIYFKGSRRIEENHEKWELISSHSARRTFVINALRLGIPPSVIMSWTGHSSYDAMKPYIKIVDSLKSENMKKFNKK